MEKILNSAMAIAEIEKLTTRKSEIAKTVEEKRSAFETADVETRDGLVKEVENLVNEGNSIDEQITQLEELRAKYEEQERAMGAVGKAGGAAKIPQGTAGGGRQSAARRFSGADHRRAARSGCLGAVGGANRRTGLRAGATGTRRAEPRRRADRGIPRKHRLQAASALSCRCWRIGAP